MSRVKKAVFIDEDETIKDIEELKKTIDESSESKELDELEHLFNAIPIKVDEVQVVESTVEVTPLRDFRCSYGNQKYFFTKNKRQVVPVAVRDFLLKNKGQPKIKDIW